MRTPAPVRVGSNSDLLTAVVIFVVVLVVFWMSPVHQITDSRYSMLLSQSLLKYHSFTLDHYSISPAEVQAHVQLRYINNHLYFISTVGSSVLSLPFVAVMNAFHTSAVNPDGTYKPKGEVKIQATIAAFLMAALAICFFYSARLVLPPGWSVLIALSAAFGTQVWSTASRGLWSHTWQLTLLGIVIWMLLAQETGKRKWHPAVMGTLIAWIYIVRPTGAIPLAAVTVYLFVFYRRTLLAYISGAAVWFILFFTYSEYHFGKLVPDYFRSPLEFRNISTALAGTLISPSRGLFVYVPIVLFVFYLLNRFWNWMAHRRLACLALFVVFAQIGVCSGFSLWWGGGSYGARYTTDLVPWFVLLAILGVGGMLKWRAAQEKKPASLAWRVPMVCASGLLVLSIFTNARGALSEETWRWENWRWNAVPAERDTKALWQWRYPQFLAGLMRPPLPHEIPLLDKRTELGTEAAAQYLWYGWSGPESQFRWTDGHEATIVFRLNEISDRVFAIKLGPFLVKPLAEQNVVIFLNGQPLTTMRLTDPESREYSIALPRNLLRETNVLRLVLPNASSLDALNAGEDPRLLGVYVDWIDLLPANRQTSQLVHGDSLLRTDLGLGNVFQRRLRVPLGQNH